MIPLSMVQALVAEKARAVCCGGASDPEDWCRLECRRDR